MTSKKRRQRGSRTHGGGTTKNRRGAGNRGGRGRAGRSKHEFHNYEPVGKHGFKRPPSVQETVLTVDLRTLDENAPIYAAEGRAEETDFGYRIDARTVVKDGHEADRVKVLGTGQLRNQLEITADDFSDSAIEAIETQGGSAIVSDRGSEPEDTEGTADDEE